MYEDQMKYKYYEWLKTYNIKVPKNKFLLN